MQQTRHRHLFHTKLRKGQQISPRFNRRRQSERRRLESQIVARPIQNRTGETVPNAQQRRRADRPAIVERRVLLPLFVRETSAIRAARPFPKLRSSVPIIENRVPHENSLLVVKVMINLGRRPVHIGRRFPLEEEIVLVRKRLPRQVRSRTIKLLRIRRHRVKTRNRNPVPRKRCPQKLPRPVWVRRRRERIVDRSQLPGAVQRLREIPQKLVVRRQRHETCSRSQLASTLIDHEEKCLILSVVEFRNHKRATNAAPVFIPLKRTQLLATCIGKPVVRIELRIPEKFEQAAVQGIRSRLRRNRQHAAARTPILGRIRVRLNPKLFNALHGWHRAIGVHVVRVRVHRHRNAVHHDRVRRVASTVHRKPADRLKPLANATITAARPEAHHARSQRRQSENVAPIQRQVNNPPVLHHAAQRRRARIDHLRRARNRHRFRQATNLQRDVNRRFLLRRNRQRFHQKAAKASLLGTHFIATWRHRRH